LLRALLWAASVGHEVAATVTNASRCCYITYPSLLSLPI
jgi:hypothetical protein